MIATRVRRLLTVALSTAFALLCAAGPAAGAGPAEMQMDLAEITNSWPRDGAAQLTVENEELHIRNEPRKQFTLWCPLKTEGGFTLSFDCLVPESRTKILLLFCAQPNDGSPITEWQSEARYDDYRTKMQTYTLGINRGKHSGTREFSPWELETGRYDTANLRRLGLLKDRLDELAVARRAQLKALKAKHGRAAWWQTAAWQEWNTFCTLASGVESVHGLNKWIRHTIRVRPPYIAYEVDGKLVFEVLDHHPAPLAAGYIGFRNMSRGKSFRLRNIVIR